MDLAVLANDAVEDQALYIGSGAHCSFGKDLPCKQLMAELKDAYCHGTALVQVLDASVPPSAIQISLKLYGGG